MLSHDDHYRAVFEASPDAMVGGDVMIKTAPGRGTLVRLTVPAQGGPTKPGVREP